MLFVGIILCFVDKPSAPQGPMRIKEISSDSVTIEWRKPLDDGGLDISSYQVERCNVGKMIWSKVADVAHDVSAYSVQKLHEDSEYMFRVCAQNAVGVSDFLDSEPVTVKCRYRKCIRCRDIFWGNVDRRGNVKNEPDKILKYRLYINLGLIHTFRSYVMFLKKNHNITIPFYHYVNT